MYFRIGNFKRGISSLLMLCSTFVFAEDFGTKDSVKMGAFLSLQGAIDISLAENLDLSYERFELSKSDEDVKIAESEFDFNLGLDLDASVVQSPAASSTLDGAARPKSDDVSYDLELSKKISTGATLTVGTNSSRDYSNSSNSIMNPYYTSYLSVGISQPLLKGAWSTVNLAPIAISHSQRRQSELELKKEILDVILDTELAYWNLSAAFALKELKDSNLELAQKLLEENKVRFDLGLIRKSDLIQAEANLAAEEEDIILANQLIHERRDLLLSILGELRFLRNPSFKVTSLPEEAPLVPEFTKVVDGAIASDMDMQITLEYIERTKINRDVAEQNLNPSLNLTAAASLRGRDDVFGNSYKYAMNAKGYGASVGLSLTFPLGLREEEADLAKASINLRQSELTMAQVQQTLMLNLRSAYRDLQASIELKKTTKKSLMLNEESFAEQKALYDAGMITFRDVLSAQSDLDTAKQRYLNALVEIWQSKARLARLDGTILQNNGFTWDKVKTKEESIQVNLRK